MRKFGDLVNRRGQNSVARKLRGRRVEVNRRRLQGGRTGTRNGVVEREIQSGEMGIWGVGDGRERAEWRVGGR
jgi:hypothetical protein